MDRFVRRVAPKLAADSAPQPVEVAAAAAPQRGARPEAVANPDADAADEAESTGEVSSVEGEYSHITGLLDELAKEQPAAGQWAAQLPSDAEVTSSFDAYLRHRARQLLGYIATLTTQKNSAKGQIPENVRVLEKPQCGAKQSCAPSESRQTIERAPRSGSGAPPGCRCISASIECRQKWQFACSTIAAVGFQSAGPHSEPDGDVACEARTLERQAGAQERCGTEKQSEGHQRRCLAVVEAESRTVPPRCGRHIQWKL